MSSLQITDVIGTACTNASHQDLVDIIEERVVQGNENVAIDFTNVHIVSARATEEEFHEQTEHNDYFIPDSQVLKWAVNLFGGEMKERVYGPDFLKYGVEHSSDESRHYFLGASQDCLDKLLSKCKEFRETVQIVGSRNGYFSEEDNEGIVQDIEAANPDYIWVGLGTPKQQEWICKNRENFTKGALLAVGFAFDVNAGTKKDAPVWMQKFGLTWFYRLLCEPRRLWKRYLVYNSIFVWGVIKQHFKFNFK